MSTRLGRHIQANTFIQALQDSVLQLEARASIAECSSAAAQQQLAQVRQQLAEDRRAYEARLAVLTEQIVHQDAVLAGAAKYLGPLESRAIPVSPVLSPRVQTQVQVSIFLAISTLWQAPAKVLALDQIELLSLSL